MNLKQLKYYIDQTFALYPRDAENLEIKVIVNIPNYVGGTPSVKVKSVGRGIDWDKNVFQIDPEVNLRIDDE